MSIWETIFKKIDNIENQYRDVFAKFESVKDANEQPLNLTNDIANYHESINSIRARLTTAIGLFKSLESSDRRMLLIPMSYLSGLIEALHEIEEALNKISGAFSNFEANGGIASINTSNFDVISINQTFTFNFRAPLQTIDTQLDQALDNFYRLHILFQRPDYSKLETITDEFHSIFNQIAIQKSNLSELVDESKKLKKQIESMVAKANTELTNGQNICTQLTELKTSADAKLQEISTLQTSAIQKLPAIEDTYNRTTALKNKVDTYQPQFENFQNQLETRTTKYKEGNQKLDALLQSLLEQENEIKRINDSASTALNFATVAGLAKGFEDQRATLNIELNNAYSWYVGSVISLFFTTLIPAIYVVGTIFQFWGEKEFKYEYAMVLLLLAVPSAIMTRFTSNRYNILFRLREQYAHKYSIAFSMDGFKKALQENEQNQLVATTFAQLSSNNPAEYIDNKTMSEKHPLPIWEKFLDFICPNKT